MEEQQGKTVQPGAPIMIRSPAAAGPAAGISSFPVQPQEKIKTDEDVMDVASLVRLNVKKRSHLLQRINRLRLAAQLPAPRLEVMVGA